MEKKPKIESNKTPFHERFNQTGEGLAGMYAGAFLPFYTGAALLTLNPLLALLFAGVGFFSKDSLIKKPFSEGWQKFSSALFGSKATASK